MTSDRLISIGSSKYISYNTKHGAEIYRRSLTVLLQCAITELYPDLRIQIGQAIMHGYYFEVKKHNEYPSHFIRNITKKMKYIVKNDDKFIRKIVTKEKAIGLYKKSRHEDKARAISFLKKKNIELIYLRDYFDHVLAECVLSTGCLRIFRLIRYKHGFILQFPIRNEINRLPDNTDRQEGLFEGFLEAREWGSILGIQYVSDLNDAIKTGRISTLIKVQEAFHEKKIAFIADEIKSFYPEKKLIFVAGPSASGKTTFIKRLGIQLRANGLSPEEINLDSYFVPREKTPKTPDGKYDFESINAIDIKYFSKQVSQLIANKEITLPKYNFKTGKRDLSKKTLKLKPNSVILIEGLHALNPQLSEKFINKTKYKIFVSALSQLFIDNDTRIFTSDIRLMRRMIRDYKFRGYKAKDTIMRFPMVREGEDRFIFPYQKQSDVFFNSSLIYEPAVIKNQITGHLKGIIKKDKEYYEARRLLNYLQFFLSIPEKEVPQVSILREFIGHSGFNY